MKITHSWATLKMRNGDMENLKIEKLVYRILYQEICKSRLSEIIKNKLHRFKKPLSKKQNIKP